MNPTIPPLAPGLGRDFLLHHGVCPRALDSPSTLRVAVAPGHSPRALDELSLAYDAGIVAEPTDQADLEILVERLTRSESVDHNGGVAEDVADLVHQAPVVRFVNLMLQDAMREGASDVHVETGFDGPSVRFRVDGILRPATAPSRAILDGVVSRLKLLADLDISERRRPQDGRLRVRLADTELDVRASTSPTATGESVVLRLLSDGARPVDLSDLGMPASQASRLIELASRPTGLLLVTGPTGSGKTTTLYSLLRHRASGTQKVVSVEDPVEYQIPNVSQTPVHRPSGVTFASALRAILRQDPDVIMVGETRDAETAQTAVQAALTGHLVLTSLHTNDAPSAVARLVDLEVPPYLLASTLTAVVAQRLVRKLCPECREARPMNTEDRWLSGLAGVELGQVWTSRGCGACEGLGYRGRVGLFETLVVTRELAAAIHAGVSRGHLEDVAREAGWRPLAADATLKLSDGITSTEEVRRVLAA